MRQIDYEFQGLCLRPYSSARIWTELEEEEEEEMPYIELYTGAYLTAAGDSPPIEGGGLLDFPDDGIAHNAYWYNYVPIALRSLSTLPLRLSFAAGAAGTAQVTAVIYTLDELTDQQALYTVTRTVTFAAPGGPLGIDINHIDIDLADYMGTNVTHLYIKLSRDSSVPADNLAANLTFAGGRAPYNA